jgi:hypothetical protein
MKLSPPCLDCPGGDWVCRLTAEDDTVSGYGQPFSWRMRAGVSADSGVFYAIARTRPKRPERCANSQHHRDRHHTGEAYLQAFVVLIAAAPGSD